MAHAGTPTDLAKQPATSTTNGLWQALLAVIVVLAIGVGMVLIASTVASSRGVAAPAAGPRIEGQRGPTTAAAALVLVDDGSYTQVETNRGGALTAANSSLDQIERQWAATGISSADGSYTQVETNRGGALMSVDTSYTQVETNRGGALTIQSATEPDCSPCPNQGATKVQGVPNIGPGRIVGHRGAMIDQ